MNIYIDIGTTTVAASNDENEKLSVPNPQKAFGLDVVSRLAYAKENGTEELRSSIVGCINSIINELSHGRTENVSGVYVSANTAMCCLFTGADPSPLAAFPYNVPDHFGRTFTSGSLGLISKNAGVFVSRCLSAFFGGDVLSGMISADLDRKKENYLYIDIGTNGEIAAGTSERTLYASTAAGPALEGGNVSCGASGITGAVSSIGSVECVDGTVKLKEYDTIGKTEDIAGLCGSALIDLLSLLKKGGFIDELGVLGADVVLPCGFTLTQSDVSALQLAKSAVRAGIECLLDAVKIDENNLDAVYIAGIMGAKIDMEHACEIGLFPGYFKNKAHLLGNMALEGARSMEKEENRERAESFASKAKKLSLSGNKRFEMLFEENILL
ncbi:MAG: DUF4445 domain-containing protein [Clostridia bacterium]|nr:DUF4445 domain-containing protein [Clostridia bacterium]